ncbi:hypothetical protein ACX80E_15555 [Arthrobacter sp. TMN-49]
MQITKQWQRTRAELLQRSLSDHGRSRIIEGLGGSAENHAFSSKHTPPELFTLFSYGEYIHWGETRNENAALRDDEIGAAIV